MTLANLTLLALRLVIGLTFAAHGAQKAFGWWNGPGLEGWRKAIAGMNLQPVGLWVVLSIGAELGGGLLFAAGLLTPLAACFLIGQATVIILKVHLPNGFWNGARGFEYPLALLAGVVAILGVGPGALSLDVAIGFSPPEPVLWLLLLVGLAGGLASHALAYPRTAGRPVAQQR